MYLTGGLFKGRKIEVPKSAKPTLSKVRESIFNMLSCIEFEDKTFLDMFAGSGIMGLEAISRGYKVKEIEINPKSAVTIKKNYENLGLKADIIICDALKFKNEKFNIIYIDPPWNYEYKPLIKKACELLKENGIIIIEHGKEKNTDIKEIIKELSIGLEIIKSKKYGRTIITFLR